MWRYLVNGLLLLAVVLTGIKIGISEAIFWTAGVAALIFGGIGAFGGSCIGKPLYIFCFSILLAAISVRQVVPILKLNSRFDDQVILLYGMLIGFLIANLVVDYHFRSEPSKNMTENNQR